MACTSKKLQPDNLVEVFNALSLFGKCQRKDLIFSDDEKKEKEKAFVKRQNEIQKELEKQNRLREEQEISDWEMQQEEKRLSRKQRTGIKYYVPPSKSRGRGSLLNGAVEDDGVEGKGRGRGRLSPKEKDGLPLFERECRVRNNLNKFSDSKLHNNQYQKMYWTELCANKNAEQDETYDPETPENGTSYDEPYIAENYNRYTPESSFTSDHFEDAVGSSQSNSPLSYTSVQSRSSGSPALPVWPNPEPPAQQPRAGQEVLSSAPCARRPRGNRIAARFTYNLEEDDVLVPNCTPDEAIGKEEDFLAVLGSSQAPLAPSGFRMGRRSSGTSFKNLHPSQRVLSSDILQPLDLHRAIAGPKNNFTLNMKDFPAL